MINIKFLWDNVLNKNHKLIDIAHLYRGIGFFGLNRDYYKFATNNISDIKWDFRQQFYHIQLKNTYRIFLSSNEISELYITTYNPFTSNDVFRGKKTFFVSKDAFFEANCNQFINPFTSFHYHTLDQVEFLVKKNYKNQIFLDNYLNFNNMRINDLMNGRINEFIAYIHSDLYYKLDLKRLKLENTN